jgi:hypothetical protein
VVLVELPHETVDRGLCFESFVGGRLQRPVPVVYHAGPEIRLELALDHLLFEGIPQFDSDDSVAVEMGETPLALHFEHRETKRPLNCEMDEFVSAVRTPQEQHAVVPSRQFRQNSQIVERLVDTRVL